jgi:hypothetical protein
MDSSAIVYTGALVPYFGKINHVTQSIGYADLYCISGLLSVFSNGILPIG